MEENALLWKWQKNKIYSRIGPGRGGGGRSYNALLTATGNGTGVATLRFEVSAEMTVTLSGTARFYTDAAGTLGESTTWTVTPGALRTIYLKCSSGTAYMNISDPSLIIKWGDQSLVGWDSILNAPNIVFALIKIANCTHLRIEGQCNLSCCLPVGLIYLRFVGQSINWSYSGALPVGLTYVNLTGALINWIYAGALSSGLTYIYISGILINWTGIDIGNTGNIPSTLLLLNYRISKMSSADMVTLLTQMTNRTGTLPSSITINDYADYASPPIEVTNAVAALKAAKSVTTVNLGA